MSNRSDDERATSFGAATEAYDAGRPSYPQSAVDWLLAGASRPVVDVCDVGAGTGKLTRSLLADGRTVVAVDPDSEMLAALTANLPNIDTAAGAAEQIPATDASLDAVVLGQAWHWVDPPVGSQEVARVLRPGGVLGLIWNIRDERTDWVAEMGRIITHSAAERMIFDDDVVVTDPFVTESRRTIEWVRPMTRPDIISMVMSRSNYLTASEPSQRAMLAELKTLLDRLFDGRSANTRVDYPYVTHAYRFRRPG